jgi:N,N-dimethylformamidase beta subunit-like protein/concanavalin A-like lectin/glucanase superfamily protein
LELVGYTDRLSVAPGEKLSFMVSSERPRYEARLVRLIHGDEHPDGPGFKEEELPSAIDGDYQGRVQHLFPGSYVLVPDVPLGDELTVQAWLCPTAPEAGEQTIVGGKGWQLLLLDGGLALRIGDAELAVGVPLPAWEWHFVAAVVSRGHARLVQRPLRVGLLDADRAEMEGEAPPLEPASAPILVGAGLNGRVEAPRLYARALTPEELDALRTDSGDTRDGLVAAWDFSLHIPTRRVADVSGNGRHGETVNMPMRAVAGRRWTGRHTSFLEEPSHYAAIHFHDDDLVDAGWEPDFSLAVPEDLPSGAYAARLRSGEAEEYLPFIVTPPRGTATASVAFLAPTLTYLAYANEHFSWSSDFAEWAPGIQERVQPSDRYMAEQRLLSLYDFHTDGEGACYSSWLRPILNFRPKWDMPLIDAPQHLGADLHLLDWLEAQGVERDVITDHELDRDGLELLRRYRVVLTGAHPEYWTERMLDGLERYLEGGGRLMYLGGNGFWWVTSIHPDAPHVVEIRRGHSGSSPWRSRPGEVHHSGTGEFGGQWRYRGRPPQRLVGIGFTAQGSDAALPYRRRADSFDPRASWIFDGVGADEPIGDFGIVMGGAGGAEIDRADPALGTPPHALVLATARGYTDMYQAQQDDTNFHDGRTGGSVSPLVRADMVFFETPGGGAVFAPGSISWCGSLSWNGYDNNVSCITGNVLRRFASPEPFASPYAQRIGSTARVVDG